MKTTWAGIQYKDDIFPKHFIAEQIKDYKKKYLNIKEEFYSVTKNLVVTPDNFKDWFQAHKHIKTWCLQEQFSGSGRLSAQAFKAGLSVLFPVDLRYGWDMKHPPHRKLIDSVQSHFNIICKFSAPDCRLWTAMSNAHPNKEKLERDRQSEFPMLDWLHNDNKRQQRKGLCYINENGLRSQMWTQTPLVHNLDIPGNKHSRLDACAHGLTDSKGAPLEKAYALDANFKLKKTI